MPFKVAKYVESSQVDLIYPVIWDIALNRAGINWKDSQQYEFPESTEIGGKFPFLCIPVEEAAGYSQDGRLSGAELPRTMSRMREPTWDYFVYGLYPYQQGKPDSWETPRQAMIALEAAYVKYWGLDDLPTILQQTVLTPKVKKIMTRDGFTYMEALLTVRVYEELQVDY